MISDHEQQEQALPQTNTSAGIKRWLRTALVMVTFCLAGGGDGFAVDSAGPAAKLISGGGELVALPPIGVGQARLTVTPVAADTPAAELAQFVEQVTTNPTRLENRNLAKRLRAAVVSLTPPQLARLYGCLKAQPTVRPELREIAALVGEVCRTRCAGDEGKLGQLLGDPAAFQALRAFVQAMAGKQGALISPAMLRQYPGLCAMGGMGKRAMALEGVGLQSFSETMNTTLNPIVYSVQGGLTPAQLDQMHRAGLRVLEEVGLDVELQEVLAYKISCEQSRTSGHGGFTSLRVAETMERRAEVCGGEFCVPVLILDPLRVAGDAVAIALDYVRRGRPACLGISTMPIVGLSSPITLPGAFVENIAPETRALQEKTPLADRMRSEVRRIIAAHDFRLESGVQSELDCIYGEFVDSERV